MIFLAITGWTLIYIVDQRPIEALMSLGIVVSGAIFYRVSLAFEPGPGEESPSVP
jgi:APA family basic amino acid/polyamine antiporter